MQTLEVKVSIPEDFVLVKKVEYDELLSADLTGQTWNMSDLREATDRSTDWLKENILYPNRKELDIENGGFVKYPENKGQRWRFGAKKMSQWLEENMQEVL